MNFNTSYPIYLQIIEKIKMDIVLEKLKLGDKLPSVRQMASELKVNVNTILRVYQELEEQGITITERGKGSFIKTDEKMKNEIKTTMAKDLIMNYYKGMRELGYSYEDMIEYLGKLKEEEKFKNGTN